MFLNKTIVARGLDAKTLPNQLAETKIGSNVLNRMASLAIRVSVRIK